MNPIAVELGTYTARLLTVPARLGGEDHTFLFDTGAGVTLLDQATAARHGIDTAARETGERMTGEPIAIDLTGQCELEIGGRWFRHPSVGVLDLARLLPPEAEPVAGAVSLQTFARRAFTLDARAGELVLETDASLPDRLRGMRELATGWMAPLDGRGIDLMLGVKTPTGPGWLEFDTGNNGPAILSPAFARRLGVDVPPCGDRPAEVELHVYGLGPVRTPVCVRDLRIDGNLGLAFARDLQITIDAGHRRVWAIARN